MFLVRRAGDVMDKDVLILSPDMSFDEFLRMPDHGGRMRHVVIARDDAIIGLLRVNTGLRKGLEGGFTGLALGEVAIRNFVTAGAEEIMFNVIGRMSDKKAAMVIVSRDTAPPLASGVLGLITKEQIADSVSESLLPYAAQAQ
jgi:CIC family chloride channel protein